MNGFFVGYYLALLLGPITWPYYLALLHGHIGGRKPTLFLFVGVGSLDPSSLRSVGMTRWGLWRDDKMGALAG